MAERRPVDIEATLLRLGGGDPFDDVLRASDAHRSEHPGCLLYPAGPRVMNLAAQVARASGARRILDLGSGLGYSTLWLADAAGPAAAVIGIDRDPLHTAQAQRLAELHHLVARASFIAGEVATVLAGLAGPFDLVHDDAWFGEQPAHFEQVLDLLRPGGVLTMANWFLLRDALTGDAPRDWAEFAGPDWERRIVAFADAIAADRRLHAVWMGEPPLLIAVRQ